MALHAGIEIDGADVCIAVVDSTSKQTSIVDYIEARILGETPEERVQSLSEILESAFSGPERQNLDVVSSIPTRMTTLREISVPFTKDEIIAKTIRYESEGHIPSASIDDLIIEYIKCSESEDSSRLLISAVQKNTVGLHLEMLRECSVDPSQIEIDATALATALHVSRPDIRGGRTLLIGMEAGHTTFVLLEEGRITRLRSTSNHLRPSSTPALATGAESPKSEGDGSESETAGEFASLFEGASVDEADEELSIAVVSDEEFAKLNEDLTASPSLPPADPDEVVERLFTEIDRTFAGTLMRSPLDRIVVSGGAAAELGIADRLAEEYEVTAQQLRVCDGVDSDLGLDQVDRCNSSGGVAVGLALQSAGQGLTTFDLRKEEHRYERRFSRLMPSLVLLGLVLCCISVSWLISNHREKQYRRQEYETVRANMAEVYMARFEELPRSANPNYLASAKRKINELKGGSSGRSRARISQFLSGLELLDDVSKGIAAANPKVYPEWSKFDMNGLKKRDGKSTVEFFVADSSAAERAISALEQHSKFFSLEESISTSADKKKVSLDLKLKRSVTETSGRK
ncbi:MAG: hypothetical protein AAEJ04_03045 [Planctomycetota bacterium]